ncbi:MAG: acyl transferase [Sphingobacteriales bacterium]|nr:acyl transferase [Sphingobacteriales bacterium]
MPGQENHKIFGITSVEFEPVALEIFHEQYRKNAVYGEFVKALGVDPGSVRSVTRIPFLPVRFFKSRAVQTGDFKPAAIFESSGTTGMASSSHLVKDLSVYEESFTRGFERVYGPVSRFCILGLLPSYLERGNSSLVYMVDQLVKQSGHPQSGFYAGEYAKLYETLKQLEQKGQPTLLIGVTYALLDFAAQYSLPLKHTIIMETGGMKGRREELIRPEVHALLQQSFPVDAIHSEYGMTELLSQAYSTGGGLFRCPPWMKVLVRDEEDPFRVLETGSGIVNIIDLANLHSCAFIATDDAGKCHADGSFEILGRVDGSDLRGCSLLLV